MRMPTGRARAAVISATLSLVVILVAVVLTRSVGPDEELSVRPTAEGLTAAPSASTSAGMSETSAATARPSGEPTSERSGRSGAGGATTSGPRPNSTTRPTTTRPTTTRTTTRTTSRPTTSRPTTTRPTTTRTTTTTRPPGPQQQFITFDGWTRPLTAQFREPVGARASSGLPVTYTLAGGSSSTCVLQAGDLLTDPRDGEYEHFPRTCRVTASQGGNASYLPAEPVTRDLVVDRVSVVPFVHRATFSVDGWVLTIGATPAGIAEYVDVAESGCSADPQTVFFDADETVTVTGPAGCSVTFTSQGDLSVAAFDAATSTWNMPDSPP